MAVLDKETFMETIRKYLVNDDDETIKDLEDLTDTVESYSNAVQEDWKTKYEQNDKAWREKYKARFFEKTEEEEKSPDEEEEEEKEITVNDLFKDKEE